MLQKRGAGCRRERGVFSARGSGNEVGAPGDDVSTWMFFGIPAEK